MTMIVDVHVHPEFNRSVEGSVQKEIDKLLSAMKRTGIDMACLMPYAVTDEEPGPHFSSKEDTVFLAEALTGIRAKYPGRFFSLLMLDPNQDTDFLKGIISKYILAGSINGVKFLTEMNAADARLDDLAFFLERNDVPVLFHAWYKTGAKVKEESNPSEIACLASKHPDLRIIMAHLTGSRFRGVQDIKKHPNVCIDTCGSQPEDGYLEYALRELGADRILYGSDYAGRDMAVQLARIGSVAMTAEEKEKILCRNAFRILEGGAVNA